MKAYIDRMNNLFVLDGNDLYVFWDVSPGFTNSGIDYYQISDHPKFVKSFTDSGEEPLIGYWYVEKWVEELKRGSFIKSEITNIEQLLTHPWKKVRDFVKRVLDGNL